MTSGKKIIIWPLILLYSALTMTGCKDDHTKQSDHSNHPLAEITAITVEKEKIGALTEIMGSVQAVDRAIIASRVNGHIVKLPVILGSKVKKSDLLVSISAGEISAKLLQAQAQLAQAERNLDREKNLLKKKAATPETVKTLEDIKRIAEASFKEAQTMLGYTRIEAPFDGTITAKSANIGDLATAGKPLLTLENSESLQVIADVPEALVLRVNIGDKLPVYTPAAKLTLVGNVTEVAPTTDPQSHTATVKLSIENHPDLRAGQFARVNLYGGDNDTIMIPESAVTSFGQMERVFVVNNDKAELRLVRTGARRGTKLEILSGLTPGETVITKSNIKLHDGQPIVLNK